MRANSGSIAKVVSLAVSISFFVGAAWIFINRQYAVDQLAVWQYTPSASIVAVADKASLSDSGKFYFYATHPVIDGTSNFNNECTRQEQGSAILGCYVHNNIYIYDVTDPRLEGVKEVTAAHEMLHAAYARLPSKERQRIDALLKVQYSKLNDSDLNKRMEYYARTEPGQEANELHSIIGTEFVAISPELEQYYSKYFVNRQVVIGLHAQYSEQFNQRTEERERIGKQLESLSAEVEALSNQYNANVAQLDKDIIAFNQRAKQGDFASQAQFNSERGQLIARSDALSADRDAINVKTDQYEVLRQQYNALVNESNSLQKSLDSTLAPAPKV